MPNDLVVELTAQVASAYVARNPVPAADLGHLVESVYRVLAQLADGSSGAHAGVGSQPAVRIKKSITDDYLVCLEDGKRFKSLKRHLMSDYGLTPERYREKWGLPDDYPMVAPSYAKSRSALALKMGFGRKKGDAASSAAGKASDVRAA